jgi:hypothetical protein
VWKVIESFRPVDNFDQGELFDPTLLDMPTRAKSQPKGRRESPESTSSNQRLGGESQERARKASPRSNQSSDPSRGDKPLQSTFQLPDAPSVRIVRSKRRKRNIAAYRQSGEIVVSVPFRTTRAEISQILPELVERVIAGEKRARKSEEELEWRAVQLLGRYLPEFHERPASISWRQMNERWGSCTTLDRTIRISERLQSAPDYVLDYVLLHELIHLRTPGHGDDFYRYLHRYEEEQRAEAYLEGFEAGERGS